MTNEQKQLLLKDLSARLPYGVKITFRHNGFRWDWPQTLDEIKKCDDDEYAINGWGLHGIKPYLRPMSSMTEDEWIKFYKWANCRIEKDLGEIGSKSRGFGEGYEYLGIDDVSDAIDWLNKNHFDYRGLIPMGLALEAPENMYKEE